MTTLDQTIEEKAVMIHLDSFALNADLAIPHNAQGLVIFAHGSGSSRLSTRNRMVASVLWDHSFATLLLDLLTPMEERIDNATAEFRFDIPLLAARLIAAIDWAEGYETIHHLPIGLFGASTGAAAALIAAAERPEAVRAVVSRGGRTDLAEHYTESVVAPTLMLVGSYDQPVVDMNRTTLQELNGVKKLEIIHGASHLFGEPGALYKVAEMAAEWFAKYVDGIGT